MIEQGFVMLVQAGLAALTPAVVVPGGFFAELPKDTISNSVTQAWTYRSILCKDPVTLAGSGIGYTEWTVQMDHHGYTPAAAIALARAVQKVLRGSFRGRLPDPDATFVDSIIRLESYIDGFAQANRTYVRTLEYQVNYFQI